jgi:NodT family efflux transporter outer membrane factor (OMF) lipoprotein
MATIFHNSGRRHVTYVEKDTFSIHASGRSSIVFALLLAMLSGCTSVHDYVANGFKVGPNYREPPTPVAADWMKAKDWVGADELDGLKDDKDVKFKWAKTDQLVQRKSDEETTSKWWTVFNDPMLDQLICHAYHQNLTLREAGYRVLAARAQLGQAIGNFFPQSQYAYADFNRNASSTQTAFAAFIPQRFYSQFDYNFNLAWELDFWGKFRRAIENAKGTMEASVHDYDDTLVTLLSDVATNYVLLRIFEERIRYAKLNVIEQQKAVDRVAARLQLGVAKGLDLDQVKSVLYQTAAGIPELEIGLRQANNQLCILLGIPPEELRLKLSPAEPEGTTWWRRRSPTTRIPIPPPEVAVGIPADLLRRRPDVQRAERQAAAQSALIGVAEADFYPHISIVGTFGWSAAKFRNLFNQDSLTGAIGPTFQWNLLNYGRILNDVRAQDATFQQLVAAYQNSILTAQQEVEDGLVTFLKAQSRTELQGLCVKSARSAHSVVLAQYEAGIVDISQLILILQNLVTQEDTLAQAQGEIATGLIQVYKALGGGWQLRQTGCDLPPGHPLANCAPPDPLYQRARLLPYPRILNQSALVPIHQDVVVEGGAPGIPFARGATSADAPISLPQASQALPTLLPSTGNPPPQRSSLESMPINLTPLRNDPTPRLQSPDGIIHLTPPEY